MAKQKYFYSVQISFWQVHPSSWSCSPSRSLNYFLFNVITKVGTFVTDFLYSTLYGRYMGSSKVCSYFSYLKSVITDDVSECYQ